MGHTPQYEPRVALRDTTAGQTIAMAVAAITDKHQDFNLEILAKAYNRRIETKAEYRSSSSIKGWLKGRTVPTAHQVMVLRRALRLMLDHGPNIDRWPAPKEYAA